MARHWIRGTLPRCGAWFSLIPLLCYGLLLVHSAGARTYTHGPLAISPTSAFYLCRKRAAGAPRAIDGRVYRPGLRQMICPLLRSVIARLNGVIAMVKVFGCRPSQVWRQGMGPAYGNRPCTNPRGCGDGLPDLLEAFWGYCHSNRIWPATWRRVRLEA